MRPAAEFFWRMLDKPGYDSCRLSQLPGGWRLSGAAVFWDGRPCHFHYEVVTDAMWRTRRAKVTGYLGKKEIDLRVTSAAKGRWRINGELQNGMDGCLDVDLGFTPATNLLVLRRLSLKVGERAEAPAVYLEFPKMRFVKLPQTYHRIARTRYEYAAPTVGYFQNLEVLPSGVIVHYPGLFEQFSPP